MVIRVSVRLISLTLGLLYLFSPAAGGNGSHMFSSPAYAATPVENGQAIFEQKCKSCHTIGGGRAVGPDLKGINSRPDTDWLVRFMVAPDKLISQGDARAKQLVQEYGFPMPNLGLSEGDAKAVLAYIESQSGIPPAATPAPQPDKQNVLPSQGDAGTGKGIFTGTVPMKNGGPPCLSCHDVSGIGLIGGGTVGKDLTGSYAGMGDAGLTSVLKAYPFPMMKEIYTAKPVTDEETANLLAFLNEAGTAQQSSSSRTPIFLIASSAGALLAFGVFQLVWRGRLAGVRRPLVKGGSK